MLSIVIIVINVVVVNNINIYTIYNRHKLKFEVAFIFYSLYQECYAIYFMLYY